MPAPAWDDLNEFLDTDDFAVAATATLQTGQIRPVNGIFYGPYAKCKLGDYEADETMPRFLCKASDVAGLSRRDSLTVPGEGVFDIMTTPQADGTGMALLELATPAQ